MGLAPRKRRSAMFSQHTTVWDRGGPKSRRGGFLGPPFWTQNLLQNVVREKNAISCKFMLKRAPEGPPRGVKMGTFFASEGVLCSTGRFSEKCNTSHTKTPILPLWLAQNGCFFRPRSLSAGACNAEPKKNTPRTPPGAKRAPKGVPKN